MPAQAFFARAAAMCGSLLFASLAPPSASAQKAAPTQGEIVVATRYFLPTGVSHAHLYLYREDGKLLRQLTNDNTGQDAQPVFAPNGETIVWTRETGNPDQPTRTFWQISPLGKGLTKLKTAPAWYKPAQSPDDTSGNSSPYFTTHDLSEDAPAEGDAAPRFQTPDKVWEVVLRENKKDEDDTGDGEGHGKTYLLRNLKTGAETPFAKLPGFVGAYSLLYDDAAGKHRFLWEPNLHVAFWELHLNSTDGSTVFALDFNKPRLVRLSPNWAAPFALPGQSAFLTHTQNRYVPIAGSQKTANSSYIEHWDSALHKIRYAKSNAAALCYGASLYRPNQTPRVITISK